jgi:hypothetical protein
MAQITVRNLGAVPATYTVSVTGLPSGWQVSGLPAQPAPVAAGDTARYNVTVTAPAVEGQAYPLHLEVTGAAEPIAIPLTFVGRDSVGEDDLALASKGATATADSEYGPEAPCAARAIDGILATPADFSNRWHSSLDTPHPHWIEIKLPKPERIGRVVVRFADPAGYPTSLQGLVVPQGENGLKPVFDCPENRDSRSYHATFAPVVTDTFRLVIRASANPAFPNAAQVSEVELYAPKN